MTQGATSTVSPGSLSEKQTLRLTPGLWIKACILTKSQEMCLCPSQLERHYCHHHLHLQLLTSDHRLGDTGSGYTLSPPLGLSLFLNLCHNPKRHLDHPELLRSFMDKILTRPSFFPPNSLWNFWKSVDPLIHLSMCSQFRRRLHEGFGERDQVSRVSKAVQKWALEPTPPTRV